MREIVVAMLVVTLLAGCGDKNGSDGPGGFQAPPQDENSRYIITLTAKHTFEPTKARVPQGAIVAFHSELDGCDVRSAEPGGPDSHNSQYGNGLIPKGGEFGWFAPDSTAEFHVRCTLHESKGMTGVVLVF